MKFRSQFFGGLFLFLFHYGNAQEVDYSFQNPYLSEDVRAEVLVKQLTTEEKIGQLLADAPAIERLNIPAYNWWNEALHGIARNGKATIFPQGIAMAATFDPELIHQVASAISDEARAKFTISQEMGNYSKYAGLTFWTPNVNIFRDPRWGRGQETYGEDPYLTSRIGVAFVNGLQGNDPKRLKTAACAKHFAVHSGPESMRHVFDARASQKDLHETYLPAFERLVKEAKVEGVMAAYNAIDGIPAAANKAYLQGFLKDQWQFNGYITSDCGAISGITHKLKYVPTPAEAAAVALKAGTNLNCGATYKHLSKALEKGLIDEQLIDQRLIQLMKTRIRLGLMDENHNHPYDLIGPEHIHSEAHVALAREVAQKSIVLLKNKNQVLPLPKDIRVPYVTGPFANSADMLMGNYYGISPNLVTILEGIADKVSLGTSLNYRSGALPFQKNINPKNWAPNVAGESDVTICVVGITADMEGEEVDAIASDYIGDRKDLKLPQNQIDYVKQIAEKKKGPLVLLIASGSPVSLEGIEAHCDAILQIWYPGEQGGNAVADVLFGDVAPSGKLPITFPKNIEQLPPYEDYSMAGRTYKFMKEEPAYPFGFGLSYTSFQYEEIKISRDKLKSKQSVSLEVKVKNTGTMAAEDVAQLYLVPQEREENTAMYVLKNFQRIHLKAGEATTVKFEMPAEDFRMINEEGESVWQKGKYKLMVANALPSELSQKLGAATPVEAIITLH
ncbi:glycoside hydrolase family 3 C-terminal domain-containing protein [Persicobacter diffluens]|uniref:Glycosyl hydrolase n=1 Tax=Persicobacter diffluens TaxID=981 RepID=A0AAN4W0Y5_9BACT|nr:glycosyl hydrolase [Persicobacter diffluens]